MSNWFGTLSLESIISQVEAAAASAQEGVARISADVQSNITTLAQTVNQLDLATISQSVQARVLSVGDEIREEEERIQNARKLREMQTIKILPWEVSEENRDIDAETMQNIFELSLDSTNFLNDPDDDEFSFELSAHVECAMKLLSMDANLSKMHSKYIVNMEEKRFWQNYFYRIFLLRKEAGLEPLTRYIHEESSKETHSEPRSEANHQESEQSAKQNEASISAKSSDVKVEATSENLPKKDSFDDLDDFEDLGDLSNIQSDVDDKELEARIAKEIEGL